MAQDIKKSCTRKLIFSIVLSVCFVIGIPLIIYGAMKAKLLMVIGIIMVALGFYGAPMAWISFGNIVSLKSVLFAITEDHLSSVSEIAGNLGLNEKDVKSKINTLLSQRFLTGYKLEEDGKITSLQKPKEENKELKLKKCPNCGANLIETKDHKYKCKYCDVTFDK